MNLKAFKDVLIREFRNFFTSRDLLVICIASPVLFSFLFSSLYYNRRAEKINIGIINADNSAMSRKLVRDFDASPELKVSRERMSPSNAYKDIFKSESGAFYFIPSDFSSELKKGRSSRAFGAADASSFILSSTVLKKISLMAKDFPEKQFVKVLVDKGYSYKAAQATFAPLKAAPTYLFNTGMNYSDFLIPGLLFALVQQVVLVSICIAVINDKSAKKRKELKKTAQGSFVAAFTGKIVPYICVGFAIVTSYVFIVFPINGFRVYSLVGYFILSGGFILGLSGFAVFISSFFRTQESVLSVLMFYSMPSVLLSGFVWPHYAIAGFLKIISYLFPSTYVLTQIRLSILGDIPLKYALIPSLELTLFGIICFFLSYPFLKKNIK